MSPHHLQQQDLYHEGLLDARVSSLLPQAWGVVSLEIDVAALGTGRLAVASFKGVLPDGTPIAFREGDQECPSVRPIETHFPATKPTLDVFLGLRKERQGVQSFAESGPGAAAPQTRFVVTPGEVTDLTGAAGELSVAFGRRNVVVLFGDEERDDFDLIKIAEIVRDGAGALAVNDLFVPPCLRVDASTFLLASLRRIVGTMVGKQRELADLRQQRDGAAAEFRPADLTAFLQLHVINGAVPVLAQMAHAGDVSPYALYFKLLEIAGQLSTFSFEADPTRLPAFVFTDLRATFEELFAIITALLRTTVRQTTIPVPLRLHDGMHVGKLEDDRLTACRAFVLIVKSDVPETEVAHRLAALSKVAAWVQIPSVIKSATPGVPLQATTRPPPEVAVRAGVVYFTLSLASEHWKQIAADRTIAIYLPPPFDPPRTQIELHGIPAPQEPTGSGRH